MAISFIPISPMSISLMTITLMSITLMTISFKTISLMTITQMSITLISITLLAISLMACTQFCLLIVYYDLLKTDIKIACEKGSFRLVKFSKIEILSKIFKNNENSDH